MKDPEFEITPEILLGAYASGVFPMAESKDDSDLFWVDPRRRGIIPLDGFHLSRSLARRMRKGAYSVALNRNFQGVLAGCADREETWINREISNLYTELFNLGHAHSLEIYHGDSLVGGVYGVTLGAAFFGESMFSRATDGSKLALAHMVDHLRRCHFSLFDTQFITPHLARLGAIEVTRTRYHAHLEKAISQQRSIYELPLDPSPQSVLHRSTQTS